MFLPFSSRLLLLLHLLPHLLADPPGSHGPRLRAMVEWGIGILYHALRLRMGSSVSPRGSQSCNVCSGETPLRWHLPDDSARLVSTLGSHLPLPLCPWSFLAFPSASKFCPSYLLIKWSGVTGVEGAIEWQGKTKKQGCTGGQGQILGNLPCHADEFVRGPEDELNWVVTRLELCLEKIIGVDGCGKWIQGGQTWKWDDPQGFTVKVQAGRDGNLHWTAALKVEGKRQLCHVFSGLTWRGLAGFGPREKEGVTSSRRGSPGRDTSLKRIMMLYWTNVYLVFIS